MINVDYVNLAVRETFGKGFSGDWHYNSSSQRFEQRRQPGIIAKRNPVRSGLKSLLGMGPSLKIAGKVMDHSGSQLEIYKRYQKAAEKYAESCERERQLPVFVTPIEA